MANNEHAKAQARARNRLIKVHYEEYQDYYRDECAKAGLRNHPTKAERIAKLKTQIKQLEGTV